MRDACTQKLLKLMELELLALSNSLPKDGGLTRPGAAAGRGWLA
jgi:hypothetical protein